VSAKPSSAVAAVLAGLLLAACGSGTTQATPTHDVSKAAAAAAYLAAVSPSNSALDSFNRVWNRASTPAQLWAAAPPMILATENFDTTLVSETWPNATAPLIRELVRFNKIDIANLRKLRRYTRSLNSWEVSFLADSKQESAAATRIRRSLGLPPPSGTSSPSPATSDLGATIGLDGASFTLLRVIDPAAGASQYTTPNAGFRFVGLKFAIKNNGSAGISDNANSDAVIIGTDDQSYTADFNAIAGCTNFNYGDYKLFSGDRVVGCVTFQIPNRVRVFKVEYTPTGFNSTTGIWRLQPAL